MNFLQKKIVCKLNFNSIMYLFPFPWTKKKYIRKCCITITFFPFSAALLNFQSCDNSLARCIERNVRPAYHWYITSARYSPPFRSKCLRWYPSCERIHFLPFTFQPSIDLKKNQTQSWRNEKGKKNAYSRLCAFRHMCVAHDIPFTHTNLCYFPFAHIRCEIPLTHMHVRLQKVNMAYMSQQLSCEHSLYSVPRSCFVHFHLVFTIFFFSLKYRNLFSLF